MATITTLRPSATSSGVGWSAVPSGTLHGVTSDDSDVTYALWSGSGSPLILSTPVDSPPAGERRHLVRMRARGEDGDAFWAVRLASGALVAGASAQFSSSPGTVNGSWGTGAPLDGSTVLSAYVTGQSTGVKITELYIDVDTREAPTFTPQILDGSGASVTLVSDTAQPIVRANAVDLDGLTARNYRYWVTLNGAIVWDTGTVSGAPVNRQTTALDNGTYVAHLQIWSTIGTNTAYASDEETITFTVSVGQIEAPENPTVDQVDGTPFYLIEACAPLVTDLDGGVAYLEVQRVDCPVGGYLQMTTSAGAYASTPDPGAVIGAQLEVQVKAWRDDDWRPATDQELISKYDTGSNQRGWRVYLDSDGAGDPALVGRPVLAWSTDGVLNFAHRATARLPIDPYGIGRLRITWVLDDGLGGQLLTFWTRETDDSDWSVLGDPIEGFSNTTVFANPVVPYAVGAVFVAGVASERFDGRIYSAEVRSVIDGTIIVNPDFTGHMDGTTTFDDGAGNEWTVHSPAAIYSPESVHTLAMLGPLATDECATYTDYALPRSGVGITCDHAPDQCCSYYRARTVGRVDGELRISDWSDVFDSGIPGGLIVMWPDTAASIPAGWERTTDLDGVYPKGVASSSTQPGTTGGATSHLHTTPGHTHDTSHLHTVTGNTAAATGTQGLTAGGATPFAVLATHTHTRSALASATVASGSTSPTSGSTDNDPARLEVIFIESDGTPPGVPDGALVLTDDISLSGWTDYANADGRFLKGAAAAGNGGATAASVVDAHIHSIPGHSHTGTSHTHTSPATGSTASATSLTAGATATLWQSTHQHSVTVGSASAAALDSGGGGNSGAAAADMRPPFRSVRVKENTSGVPDLPVGVIAAWRNSLGSIPDNWALCDGTDATPDLTAVYPQGATSGIGTTGGSLAAHTHGSPSHSHGTSGHAHTETVAAPSVATANVGNTSTVTVSSPTHTHSATNSDSTTPIVVNSSSGTLAAQTSEPVHEEVAFIQMKELPGPPDEPDTFCLTWSDDEHLVRSTGPDGALWSPIKGKFEWDVDRPFTASTGVNGSRFVTSAPPGGRNLAMTAAVESEAELAQLRAVLARPLVLVSPSDANEVWAAPVAESVRIVKVGRIRQVTAAFIATGPQPPPQLADVA